LAEKPLETEVGRSQKQEIIFISLGREFMSSLLALSLSIAVLGAVWAFLALGPLSGFVLVWAGFIADTKALIKTIVGMIYGAVLGWITLLVIVKVPVPALGTVWPALVVGFFVFFLVIVASIDLLSVVPANVYGFAALVGYTLSAGKTAELTAASAANPLSLLILSYILGAVFGYVSGQAANALGKK
jgi:hypothetical protein